MKKNKLIVLGIDGLEYRLVQEFKLDSLKQKKYCKTDLSDFDVVVTPPIWASMLTGKIIPELITPYKKNIEMLKNPPFWLLTYRRFMPKRIRDKARGLFGGWANPGHNTGFFLSKKKFDTIFDLEGVNCWNNTIPSLNRDYTDEKYKRLMKENKQGYLHYAVQDYNRDKNLLLNALEDKHYDLIFWYTSLLDKVGHILISKKIQLMDYYLKVNNLVQNVIEIVNENAVIYIISDHGMQRLGKSVSGIHSDYGFFSSNTGELINKPQNLYNLMNRTISSLSNNKER